MAESVRRGVRLGIDVGMARIGVASCDAHAMLATPVRTVSRYGDEEGMTEIAEIASEMGAIELVVGLPRNMNGSEGHSALSVRAYAEALCQLVSPLPVRLVDERLTTVSAHQVLHKSGRRSKKHRSVVDQVAAVMILQTALDQERNLGAPAGELVRVASGEED